MTQTGTLGFRGTTGAIVVGRAGSAMGAAFVARSGRASDPAAAAAVVVVSAPATSAHAIVTVSVAWISAMVRHVRCQ